MKHTACYHLPGLFEFYELYRLFLPLFREHREYFYDWCEIGSIYGAPPDCIWGGGRVEAGEHSPAEVLALTQEYGISARLTFSNSLLRPEHLSDRKCNAVCQQFAQRGTVQNGVIVHSELLLNYLQQHYPELYLVSSTTKVLTDLQAFQAEVRRPEFRYVVPDFRLNKSFDALDTLSQPEKDKVEFLCNECCWFGCTERRRCYEAAKIWERSASTGAPPPARRRVTAFPRRWKTPGSSALRTSGSAICRWAFPISSWKGAGWAARWCWSFCSII